MKSSSGLYFIGLDHVRAVAAFMVFCWHFIHVNQGQYAPAPIFPLSLLTEGHTGVSLFMTLSGYLFAKLLDGKQIIFSSFLWNRFIRLFPLLFIVILLVGVQRYFSGADIWQYSKQIIEGVVKPNLPNGGWSITVEFHFYLILPLLLLFMRKWKYALLLVLCITIASKAVIHQQFGQVQTFAYWTIVGRIDQFLLGILLFQFRHLIAGKHILAITTMFLFAIFYWWFDTLGGMYKSPTYPSPSALWIIIPGIEGLAYAVAIAWYDNSFKHSHSKISRFIASIGTYSYSIYLLHFFVVFAIASFIDEYIKLSNIYLALAFAVPSFFLMVPIAYLSYRFIELPFLRFRSKYIISNNPRT